MPVGKILKLDVLSSYKLRVALAHSILGETERLE